MGETSTDVFNIGRRVQSRHNFTRLSNLISSTPETIVVIPNGNVLQSDGDQGAIKQSVVSYHPIPQSYFDLSPVPNWGGGVLHQTPQSRGDPARNDPGSNVFVPSWSLRNDSRLSVRTDAIEFSCHAFPPVVVTDWKLWAATRWLTTCHMSLPEQCFIWSPVPTISSR